MKTKIMDGNSKLGKIPNVSLAPCISCNHNAPCKGGPCYALKFYKMYPSVKNAWYGNTKQAKENIRFYFADITMYLNRKQPRFFRYHVSGDILDQEYLEYMKKLAGIFPKTKFLAFTKMHDLDYKRLPENLKIVFSMWPGWGNKRKKMPRAWMQDGTEKRVPKDAIKCPGNCEACGMCWNLETIGKDVVFYKH